MVRYRVGGSHRESAIRDLPPIAPKKVEAETLSIPRHPFCVDQWLPRSSAWVRLACFQFRTDATLFARERARLNGNPQSFRIEVLEDEAS